MANLLSLPVEVREIIYGYVWCHTRYVRFGVQSVEDSWTMYEDEGPRFPEKPSSRYPPAASKGRVKSANSTAPPASGSIENKEHSAGRVVQFDVDAFLKENTGWDEGHQPKRRYRLDCFTPVNLALFRVNSQFYRESRPVFYKERTFVFDSCGLDAIRFLNSMPNRIRSNISSIGLTGYVFMGDDRGSRVAWSGDKDKPIYLQDGLQLNTPFAAFLATKMSGLQEVYYYVPYGGDEEFYASWAPKELGMLLIYGRINRLCHVFSGKEAKRALDKLDSNRCYAKLMGGLGDGEKLATYRWQLVDPGPKSQNLKDLKKWLDDEEKF